MLLWTWEYIYLFKILPLNILGIDPDVGLQDHMAILWFSWSSFGISDFLEEIPSLSHSVVFLYFFALIAEEGVLISSCYSFELCIRCLYFSFSPLLFTSLLFTAICKASPDSHLAFLHFFSLGMVLIPASCIMSRTSVFSSSGTLSIRSSPLNLFYTSTV